MDRIAFLTKHFEREDGVSPAGDKGNVLPKHEKMTTTPFVFFRGSAPLFYADIKQQIISLSDQMHNLPDVYVMGDCHASNFGFFSEEGSHSGSVIFAPNDFDDACVGNACWDLIRFCTSLYLCQAHCQQLYADTDKPIVSRYDVETAIQTFLHAYSGRCEAIYQNPLAINWAIDTVDPFSKLAKYFQKARRRAVGGEDFASKSTLAKATSKHGSAPLKFAINAEKFVLLKAEQYRALEQAFSPYMDDSVCDIVARIGAGTGSVNLERFYFLVGPGEREHPSRLETYHIVEVKQQRLASPLRYDLMPHPVNSLNPAHLTARCQRHMQRNPDLLLDEVEWQDKHWLIRSRHHAKVGLDPENIAIGRKNIDGGFHYFATLCGQSLALAHCRSSRRGLAFERFWVENRESLSEQIATQAESYMQQVLSDYTAFCRLVRQ